MLSLLLISSWKDNYGWTVVFKVNKSEYMDSENGIMNFILYQYIHSKSKIKMDSLYSVQRRFCLSYLHEVKKYLQQEKRKETRNSDTIFKNLKYYSLSCNSIIICIPRNSVIFSRTPGTLQPFARRIAIFLRTRMSTHVAIAQINFSTPIKA